MHPIFKATLLLAAIPIPVAWMTAAAREPPPAVPCPCGESQDGPLNKTGACLGDVISGGRDDIVGAIAGWAMTWHFRFTCQAAPTSACAACHYGLFTYWDPNVPPNGRWFVAPGGQGTPTRVNGQCNTSRLVSGLTETYTWPVPPGPIKNGVLMRCQGFAGGWDPDVSADCFGQDYEVWAEGQFICDR